jgi:cytochrome c-type biogenesis protein CcmH
MMFVLLVVAALVSMGFVLWPFVRPTTPAGDLPLDAGEELRLRQAALYEAIRELDFDYQAGQYSQEDYQRQRLHYEQQAAAVLQALDQQAQVANQPPQVPPPHQPAAGGRHWLRWGVIMGILALCGLGWGYWLGRATSGPPNVSTLLAAADAALARGNVSDALQQYRAVLEQAPENVTALTKLAILAQRSGQPATGLRLIERVLKQQPRYPLAWQAKGFMHYTQGDYQKAITAWETYLRLAPDNDPHRKPIETLIAQSKQRVPTAKAARTDAAPATISGTITLAREPSSPIPTGAALFIIARPDTGPPLAVKRIVDPQFPLHYTLGMNDVMLSGRAFTGTINVSARLQTSGAVGPSQPGDLVGHYPGNPVTVGATGVDIVLERQR